MFVSGVYFVRKTGFFDGVEKNILSHPGVVMPAILAISLPAILTNLTTPLANAYVTRVMAVF